MSITLNFELNDRDLAHFQEAAERSRKAAEGKSEQEIVDCAVGLLADAQKVHIPDFIKERLLRLDDMIAMVRDTGWALPDDDKQREDDRVERALGNVQPDERPTDGTDVGGAGHGQGGA